MKPRKAIFWFATALLLAVIGYLGLIVLANYGTDLTL
jgi:hypothetical protein